MLLRNFFQTKFRIAIKQCGFTLVELLVTISIIAIISLAGVVVYTNVQQGARDARRREDLASIAAALETARNNEVGVYGNVPYSILPASDFPKDPSGARYCFAASSEPLVPQPPSRWDDRSSCPSGYVPMPVPNSIGSNIQAWRVCSLLEKGSDLIFCRHNSQ